MKTILCIEDNALILADMEYLLTDEGFRAVGAISAAEACQLYDRDKPDLILTDWNLRGETALSAIQHGRLHNPDLPIFVVTGNPDGWLSVQAKHPHLADIEHLVKPVPEPILIATIHRTLNGSRTTVQRTNFLMQNTA